MDYRVYKYYLQVVDDQRIMLRGKPLSAVVQGDAIVVYALYSEEVEPQSYLFHISGTGHPIPDTIIQEYAFLDTVLMYGGKLVFHIFYKSEE